MTKIIHTWLIEEKVEKLIFNFSVVSFFRSSFFFLSVTLCLFNIYYLVVISLVFSELSTEWCCLSLLFYCESWALYFFKKSTPHPFFQYILRSCLLGKQVFFLLYLKTYNLSYIYLSILWYEWIFTLIPVQVYFCFPFNCKLFSSRLNQIFLVSAT